MAMAKKGLRKVHIDGVEWIYKVHELGMASVFRPGTKECVLEVWGEDYKDEDGNTWYDAVTPGLVKSKIEEYLEENNDNG